MKTTAVLTAIIAMAAGTRTGAAAAGFQADSASVSGKPMVYMVSNAHFDTQWRWTVQRSINEYLRRTLTQNFALFEEYPDYIFNFEGAVKYAWAKEYYPQMYERLKEYVAAGRWHISGSSWDANDPNLPSIESGIRNILYGQDFYRREFGVISTDIMLPDCFGFGCQVPAIAAHCGLTGFATQKISWRNKPFFPDGKKVPFCFGIWKGLDGSRVMATLDGGGYAWSPEKPVTDDAQTKKFLAETAVPAAFRYFGIGDSGGAAHPKGIRFVNEAVHNPGPAYDLKFATSDEMFQKYLWDSRLPEYEGEFLMDVHATGCYSSKAEMKNLNRRNEYALSSAEGISVYADRIGGLPYPAYQLDNGWKRVLWHQFHDDITGTSLPECYQFSYNDEYLTLRQTADIVESATASAAAFLDTRVKGTPVVIYNPISGDNGDVASVLLPLDGKYRSVNVYSPDGKKVKAQIAERKDGMAQVLFAGSVPSLGMAVYGFVPSTAAEKPSPALRADAGKLENRVYRITLDANGDIASIFDKRYGKELVREGESFHLALFENNVSDNWPAWEIHKEVLDRASVRVCDNVKVSVEECGPLRAVLKVERKHAGSTFIQRIILTDGACDDRIDIVNTVDWRSRASILKASFPVAFDSPNAVYDIGMGHVARGVNTDIKYEVYAHKWADMTASDGSYGVTVMNDSKYGWDKPDDHTLRLTLFHTPTAAKGFGEQATQDFGEHTFTYSIVGHKGELNPAGTDMAADFLNCRKYAYVQEKHSGKLGKSFQMARSTNPALRIKAFKKALDGDGLIVRVYELSGKGASGKIEFDSPIVSAEEVNGMEDYKGAAVFSGNALEVNSGKFALKTFRVRLAAPSVKAPAREYTTLSLPFNIVGITTDALTAEGGLAGDARESFAAEILPEKLVYKGVPFVFGEANYDSAVRCDGQKLSLPENTSRVCLLVASQNRKSDAVEATFTCGGKSYAKKVSNYAGFYGVYGWPGYYDSALREDEVAYIGTHTHNPEDVNKAYVFSYLYLVEIPVCGAGEITLPSGGDIVLFSATAEK